MSDVNKSRQTLKTKTDIKGRNPNILVCPLWNYGWCGCNLMQHELRALGKTLAKAKSTSGFHLSQRLQSISSETTWLLATRGDVSEMCLVTMISAHHQHCTSCLICFVCSQGAFLCTEDCNKRVMSSNQGRTVDSASEWPDDPESLSVSIDKRHDHDGVFLPRKI